MPGREALVEEAADVGAGDRDPAAAVVAERDAADEELRRDVAADRLVA